jgi:hypothetical protein
MPIFACDNCGCIENTALSGYWFKTSKVKLCSECDPAIRKWHGAFKKRKATKEELNKLNGDFIVVRFGANFR